VVRCPVFAVPAHKPKRTDDVLEYLLNLPLTFGQAVHALQAALCEEAR
jgi:hypothetical protein